MLICWLMCGVLAWADTPAVTVRPTLVQSGPGTIPPYYATARLEAGQSLVVVGEVGDFYAIQPPAGSFSYVPRQAIRLVSGEQGVGVVQQSVNTLIGSHLGPQAHTEGARLSPGTLVRILGEDQIQLAGQVLEVYRIEPIGEKRYVPKSAVRCQHTVVEHHTPATPKGSTDTLTGDSIRQRAQEAYRRGCQTGDFAEAKSLYEELSRASDSATRWEALNRLEFIRLREQEWASRQTRTIQPAAYVSPQSSNPQVGSSSGQEFWRPAAAGIHATASQGFRVSGLLRRSAWTQLSQPLYYLEDHQGRLRCYVQVKDAITAERWVGRAVEVTGQLVGYRGDLRAELITAEVIRPLE